MMVLNTLWRRPIQVLSRVVLCDLCRDEDAVNAFVMVDPVSGSQTTNVCAYCTGVQAKASHRLAVQNPRLTFTCGPVS